MSDKLTGWGYLAPRRELRGPETLESDRFWAVADPVLFHHAVAEQLGLGPTDHKCLDLIVWRQPVTGSEPTAVTGLTSGGVKRLERAGYIRRMPDPEDGCRQLLRLVPERFG
ncbi:hypothetical protein [Rhodococcus indonesiensis]